MRVVQSRTAGSVLAVSTLLWLVLVLLAGTPSKLIGDGGEYYVTAVAMAQGAFPPFRASELERARAVLVEREPKFSSWDVGGATWSTRSGRKDFVHFWVYPLLATPGVWIALRLGSDVAYAFVLLNVVFLSLATAVAVRRCGVTTAVLICASPILWWADKVHGEAFTFSLLTVAVCSVATSPRRAMVAIGLAATQNPPLALLLLPYAVAQHHIGSVRPLSRLASGAVAGVAIALLHPAYYLLTVGRVSPLTASARGVVPSFQELGAVLYDPNIGLIPNNPVFAVAVAIVVGTWLAAGLRAWADPERLAALVGLLIVLGSVAQTTNIMHGGTPGISRYALWLIPFAAPLLATVGREPAVRRILEPLAGLAALTCLVAYWPAVGELAYRPSPLARILWTRMPALNNPLPEVFGETVSRTDGLVVLPSALHGCEKALLIGGVRQRGYWPVPCYPSDAVPTACRSAGSLCYANRRGNGYSFAQVERSQGVPVTHDPDAAWAVDVEPVIRRIYDEADWWTLRPGDEFDERRAVRQVTGVERFWHFQSDRSVLLVVRGVGSRAHVSIRPPKPMSGALLDAATGERLRELSLPDGPSQRVDLPLPAGRATIIVILH